MLIAIFARIRIVHQTLTYTEEEVAAGLQVSTCVLLLADFPSPCRRNAVFPRPQNFIICIEMFAAAVMHRFFFYWKVWFSVGLCTLAVSIQFFSPWRILLTGVPKR
jgi:hypothetical protein